MFPISIVTGWVNSCSMCPRCPCGRSSPVAGPARFRMGGVLGVGPSIAGAVRVQLVNGRTLCSRTVDEDDEWLRSTEMLADFRAAPDF